MTQTPDITPEAVERIANRLLTAQSAFDPDNRVDAHNVIRALAARLAEVEAALAATVQREADTTARYDAKLDAAEARIAHLEDHIEGVAKDTHKIMVAYEAALPAVYRLGLDEGANVAASGTSRNDTYSKGRNDAATVICALPTPTAAELMARIKEKNDE